MDIKKEIVNQFGSHADNYVKSGIHAKGYDLKLMVELSGVDRHDILLDVATGGGHTANAFAPLVKEVIAYDLTPQMLEAARRFIEGNGHKNVTFVQGDAEALPFESETFDYVTCRLAAHHFPRVDLFIQESYRVLKRDGYLLLIDNVAPEREELDQFYNGIEKERDYTHHRAWKKSEWIRFLEEEGFLIEVMIRYEKRFHFPDWCDRVQLSSPERESLTQKILSATPLIKGYFNVEIVDHQVIGFTAESVLIKAKKGGKNPSTDVE